jgi:transcriptional regulator with XRE-family HTH domain
MSAFADRLRSEIEYIGLNQKEFAAKAGIKKRALDMYLGSQGSIPRADMVVKMAAALGISVEYLVTGVEKGAVRSIHPPPQEARAARSQLLENREDLQELLVYLALLPREVVRPLKTMVKAITDQKRGPANSAT